MCRGKEGVAIRTEACFLHIEYRIAAPDAVHGATYGAAAEVGEKCGLGGREWTQISEFAQDLGEQVDVGISALSKTPGYLRPEHAWN